MSLSRSGYLIHDCSPETKKELTVRAVVNNEFGFPPPAFKVFKSVKKTTCVPQFYGLEKFGKVVDNRPPPTPLRSTVKFVGKLRTETCQVEAFTKGVTIGHGVLSLPCGFGKTTVALAMAVKLGYRTMIIVHKEFLANQWRERIKQFCPGATIGVVQQDKIEVGCDFVIGMLQSISTKKYTFDQFESIGTLFVDEAHHICARVFSQSLFKLCPRHCYGLSATPERKDGLTKVLHWFLGPIFFEVERKNQTDVVVEVIPYDCPMYKQAPPCNRNGKVSFVQMVTDCVENKHRTKMLIDLIKRVSGGTHQVLVLSDRRLHCEEMHSYFTEVSGLYMGGMKEEALEESSRKSIIFGTYSQAHEGLDIPTLDTIILTTPKSDIKQAIGRILRETPGKNNSPRIFDIWDKWSLLNAMYTKRRKVYRQGGFIFNSEIESPPDTDVNLFKGKCLL